MAAKRPGIRSRKSIARPSTWTAKKTALITGASGGIGHDLSAMFAENGYGLVLVARSKDKLSALAEKLQRTFGVPTKVLPLDLARPESPEILRTALNKSRIEVDILVNNAGFGLLGPFGTSNVREQLEMTQLNVTSVVHLTRLFLGDMLKRGEGKILNVASTGGFQPGPLMANYYATKAYVLSFSVALAEEVLGTGVSVSVLCPGPTITGFQKRARIRSLPGKRLTAIDPRTVARIGYEGLMTGKTIIVPGALNKLATVVARLLPMTLIARVVQKIQERRQ